MYRKLLHAFLFALSFAIASALWTDADAQSVRMPQNGNQVAQAQGTVIYDNGGNGNYAPNSKGTLTVLPAFTGGRVTLNFTSWDLDCNGDYLYIYDGLNVDAPVLGIYSCHAPATVISANTWNTSGALTLRFVSDNAVQGEGFVANAITACGAGVIELEQPYVVEGGSVKMYLVGEIAGTVRWELTTDFGRTWIPIPGLSGMNVSTPPVKENTQYRAVVECPSGTAYSTIAAVQVVKLNIKKEEVNPKKDDTAQPMATCAVDFPNNPLCTQPPFSINAIASPQTICQGQSTQLTATATSVSFFDNFTSNQINCTLWNCTQTNGEIGTMCGSAPQPASGGNTMYFRSTQPLRRVTTRPQNTQDGGSISFWIRLGAENACESPDICGQEEVFLEYSINGGIDWVIMYTFGMSQGQNCNAQSACTNNNNNPVPLTDCNPWRGNFVFLDVPIPPAARTANTIFRFRQNQNSGGQFDNWALDDVRINIGSFNYVWHPQNTLNNPNISNPIATPTATTTYSVAAVSTIGNCCMDAQVVVTVNPTNPGTVSAPQTICSGATPNALTVTGNLGPVVRWESTMDQCTPQSQWGQIFNQQNTYNPGQLTNNNQTPLIYCYRAVTQPQGCAELFSNCACITVNPVPALPTVTPNPITLCSGQVGGQFTVQNPNNGTYNWYTVPNGGTPVGTGTTFTIPPPNQGIVYYVENIVNGCTSARRGATVLINNIAPPNANGATFCRGQNGAEICVNTPIQGETYRWFDQQVGGTLLGTGTCFNSGGTIANTNGTFQYYVERIASGCTSTRTTVTVTVSTPAGPTLNNANACVGQTGVNVCVNNPINGTTYAWYAVPNGGTPVNTGTCFNNMATGTPGTFTFYVEAIVQGCTSTRSQVRLTVADLAPPTFFPPQPVCPGQTADLFPTGPAGAGIRFFWYATQTSPTPLNNLGGDVLNQPFTTAPINANPTCYWLEYTDNQRPGCRSPRTEVCVNWDPNSPPAPTPLFTDSVICSGDFIQIRLTAPQSGYTFTWSQNGVPINPQNRSFPAAETFIGLPIGVHTYEVVASANGCVGPPATVTITVAEAAIAGNLTGPTSVCAGQPVTLTLENHTGFVQNWERNVNNGGWTNVANTQTTYTDLSVTQPTCYRAVVGPCNPQTTPDFCVTIGGGNLNPGQAQVLTPPATWTATRTACGNFNPTVRLTGHTGQVVRWESSQDGGPYNNTVTTLNVTTITPALSGTQMCFRAIVESAGCGDAPSQPACISIDQVTGDLSQDATICEGGCTGNLTLGNVAGDIAGWQSTTNIQNNACVWSGLGFVNPVLNNQGQPELGNTISRCGLTASTCYRARIQSALFPDPNSCATLLTNEIRITVRTPSVGGTVASAHTICEGSNSNMMMLSGHNGNVTRWEFDTNGDANFIPISNTLTTYTATGLTAGVYCFRAVVQNAPCTEVPSATACVTVDPPTIAGTTSSPQTICQATQPQALTLTGQRGVVQSWQRSTDGGNTFTNIGGSAGLTTLTPVLMGNLMQSTCFRAVVKSGVCPELNSGITCIDVDLPSLGGTLSAAQTICQATEPNPLTLVGHRGTILNWESATNQGFTQGLTTIVNTNDTYSPAPLNALTCYRAVVKNGTCPPANSNIICISVDLPSQGGTANQPRTVCEGSSVNRLYVSGKTGVVQRWERDDTGNDFVSGVTNVPASNNDTIRNLPFAAPGQVCFRAVVKNGVCPEVFSVPVCVQVDANANPGTLSSAQTICVGQTPTPLCLTGNTGNILYYTYSPDNFVSQDTIRITSACLTFGQDHPAPTVRTSYRAIVKNGVCPNFTSNTVVIEVDPAVIPGTLAQSQTVCTGSTVNLTLTGNNGTIEQWEISSDNTFTPGPTTTVTNSNANTFTTPAITATRYVRVGIRSGTCPLEYSNVVTISVHPDPVAGTLSAPATVCANNQAPNVTLNLANHSGTIVNWQYATDCNAVTWTDESPVNTTTSLTVPALTNPGRCYRVRVTNLAGNCTTVISNTVFIQADALPTVGTLSANPMTVCSGQSSNLTLTGSSGTVTRWEIADNQTMTPSTNFSLTNITTIATPTQTALRCYRAWVSNGVCPEQPSNTVCVDVFPSVSGGSVTPDQTVCVQGGAVQALTLSGHQGPIIRWEVAPTNTFAPNATTVINQTGTTYTPTDNPPVARCYRAIIQAGGQCPEVASNPACITVDARPTVGTLTSDQTVCIATPTHTMTLTGYNRDIIRWTSADNRDFNVNIQTITHTQAQLTVNPTQTTCYRAWVSNGVCPAEPSNVVCVTVDQLSLAGTPTLTGNATICQGSATGPFNLTGHRTDVLRWEFRIDNGAYTPIASSNNATLTTTGPLNTAGTYCYRAVVQNGICPSVNSADVCVQVDAPTQAATVTAPATVCRLGNNGTLNATLPNGIVVRWEQSADGNTWNPSGGGVNPTLNYTNLTQTTFFRIITRNGVCPEQPSNSVRIQVDPASVATQITGTNAVCEGNNTGNLTLDIPNVVGFVQNWQTDVNCTGNFTDMNPANPNTTFSFTNLVQTTCYRAIVKSGECPQDVTPSFRVDVTPMTVGGTVAPARTICLGDPTGQLSLSGQTGNVVRWELANDCTFGTGLQTASVTTMTTLNFTGLTTTSCFRAVVQSPGCPARNSEGALVTVIQQPNPGQVTQNHTICFNGNSNQLTLSGHQGTILRWQSSPDATAWTDIPSTGGLVNYTANNLQASTYFRAVLEAQGGNGQCGERNSAPALVTVDPATVAGTLSQNATLCITTPATGTLTLTGNVGNVVRWERSNDNFVANTVTVTVTTNTLQYLNLTETTSYRVVVKSGVCEERTSNSVRIQVDPSPTAPLAGADQVICSVPGSTTLSGNVITVGTGTWTQVSGPNNAVFTAGNPTSGVSGMIAGTYVFRWTVVSGVCPPVSDEVTITVDQDPSAPNAGLDQTICQSSGSTTLTGSTPAPASATGQWSFISGPNGVTPVIANAGTATTLVSGMTASGSYTYRWTVRNGTVCLPKTDDVVIVVDPTTVAGTLATSGTVCQNDNRTLTLTGQVGTIQRWEQNVNGGGWVQIGGASGSTYNIVGIQTTTSYRVVVRSGVCPAETTNVVVVTVDPTTVGGSVTTDATVCRDGNSGLLRLGGHVGTVQRWEFSTNCTGTYTSLSNTTTFQTYTNLTETTCYRAVVKSGVCLEQPSSPAQITVVKPSVTGTKTDILCFGETNGTINITPSGGFPFQVGQPYRYIWTRDGSNYSTDQNLTGLGSGRYCVTVTDGIDCPITMCLTVTEPSRLVSTFDNMNQVSCNGAADGRINITVTGGVTNYSYVWTKDNLPFGTPQTEDLSGLNPGTYSVTITDANGCLTNLGPFVIGQPSAIISTTSYIKSVTCNGLSNGSIGHHVTGGTSPYTYLWSPGGMVTEDVENLRADVYTVTITDATGCTLVKDFTVTEPNVLEIRNVQIANARCHGGSDGSIRLDVLGGTPPYMYVWSNGARTEDIFNVSAGDYEFYVRDAKGCTVRQVFTLGAPEAIVATVSEIRPVLCSGGSTGALRVKAVGGVPPYTYLWNTGSTADSTVGLSSGGYSVSVRDASGCLTTVNYTLSGPAKLMVKDLQLTNVSCKGGNNGAIAVQIEGGDANYTFVWNDGSTEEDRFNLGAGNYTLTVTDGQGCTLAQTFTVKEPLEALTVSVNKLKLPGCSGANDGSIDINILGGVAPYAVLWSNGSTSEDLTNIGSGDYVVTVKDAWGCEVRTNVNVSSVPVLVSQVNFVKNPSCYGRTNGSIGVQISGGQPPYTYLWSGGQTTEDIENVGSGDYTMTVTDARGCSKTVSQKLVAPSAIEVSVVRITTPTCYNSTNGGIDISVRGGSGSYSFAWSNGSFNQNLQNVLGGGYSVQVTDGSGCVVNHEVIIPRPTEIVLSRFMLRNVSCHGGNDGSVAVSVSGGSGPYAYEWRLGNQLVGTGMMASALKAGVYNLKVTDSKGCVATLNETISEPEALSLVLTSVDLGCSGQTTGSVSSAVSGGTSPYKYVWNTGATTANLSNLGKGVYQLTVTDAKGCVVTGSAEVISPAPITLTLVNKTNVTCKSANDGSIEVTAEGGVGKWMYQWNTGISGNSISGLAPGSYSVTVTDASGCTSVLNNLLITEPKTAMTLKISYIKDSDCGGVASGSIGLDVTGGSLPYTYAWSNGTTNEDPDKLLPGVYSVTVTDASGCQKTLSAEVKGALEALRVESLFIQGVTCNGGSDGSINLDIRGGTQPYTYRWTNGSTAEDQLNLKAGVYRLEVRDAKNCLLVRSFEVTEAMPMVVVAEEITASGCIGSGTVRVAVSGGQEPYTYQWSNGSQDRDLSGAVAGTYQLSVRDGLGCVYILSVSVPALPSMVAEIVVLKGETCFGRKDGILDLRLSGGTAPYTYLWSNGATTEDISNAGGGLNGVVITDATGCVLHTSIDVPSVSRLDVSLGIKVDVRCSGSKNGLIGINVSGGSAPYSYVWSNGSTQEDIANLGGGIYEVTVTDSRRCEAYGRFEITEPSAVVVTEDGVSGESCAGAKDGRVGVSVVGGVAPYQYVWNTGGTGASLTDVGAGVYTVTVSDANGCRSVKTMTLVSPSPILITTVSIRGANCNGGTNGGADISVSGGTKPYRYLWSNMGNTEDLAGVPAGVYDLIVMDANNCRATYTVTIPTLSLSNVKISGLPTSICSGGSPVVLTGSPSGGTFSGSGMSGNTFNPANLSAGNYEITYKGVMNGCMYETKASVRVNARPTISAIRFGTGQTSFCRTENVNYALSVQPIASGTTYIFSGRGVSKNGNTYRFNPSQAGSGVHAITVTAKNIFGCQTTFSQNVVVSDPSLVRVLASSGTICSGGVSTLLASGAETYEWKPSVGLNQTTGSMVEARPTATTTYTVTGISGGCRTTATVRVVVGSSGTVAVSQSPGGSVCAGVPVTLKASGSASYVWSPSTGLNTNVGSQVVAQVNATTTYTVVGTSASGCTSSTQVTVSISPSAISASADATSLCGGGTTTLRATGGSGSYLWMPGNMTGGVITVAPLVTTTYTVKDVNGGTCDQAVLKITVNPTVQGGISGVEDRYCLSSPSVVPVLMPLGGTLTLNGKALAGGVFTPSGAGVGVHQLVYQGTNGVCEYRFVRVVEVGTEGFGQLLNVKDEYCSIGASESIQAMPVGGRLTVDGELMSVIDPRSLSIGTHEVRYTGVESNGCTYDVRKTFVVRTTEVRWLSMPTDVCSSGGVVALMATPSGGTWRIDGTIVTQLDPKTLTLGTHEVTYSGVDGPCTYSRTAIVRVSGIQATAATVAPTNQSIFDGSITVTANGGNGVYQYSLNGGNFVNSNTFSNLGVGTYTITVRDGSGCTTVVSALLSAPACGRITGLRVVPGVTTADVSWDAVNGASGYVLSWRKVGVGEPWRSTNVALNQLRIVNLLPGERYEVRVRARCGGLLGDFSEIVGFTQLTGRESDVNMSEVTLSVYPNPTKGLFTVQLSGESQNAVAEVFDLTGRMILRRVLASESTELSLENVTSGIYTLKITLGNEVKVVKVVRE